MTSKMNVNNFLQDTQKLIQEGCPRKVVIQFQLFPVDQIASVTDIQRQQLYHRQIHSITRVLQEYLYKQSNMKNKSKLLKQLFMCLKYSQRVIQSPKYLALHINYIIHGGIILLHESKTYESAQVIMDYLIRIQFHEKSKNQTKLAYSKMTIKYNFVLTHMKFNEQENTIKEIHQLIDMYQAILPIIYKEVSSKEGRKNKKNIYYKFTKIITMAFYILSIAYEQTNNIYKAKESLKHSLWLLQTNFSDLQQLNYTVQKRIDDLKEKYNHYLRERKEINKVMAPLYDQKQKSENINYNSIEDYLNEQLYHKFGYQGVSKQQLIRIPQRTLVLQKPVVTIQKQLSPQSLNQSQMSASKQSSMKKQSTRKFSAVTVATETNSAYQTTRIESAHARTSTILKNSSSNTQLEIFESERKKPEPAVETVMTRFLQSFQTVETHADEISKPPTERKLNLDSYLENIVVQKLNQTDEFNDIATISRKVFAQQRALKNMHDISQYSIKFLNQKKSNKLYSKKAVTRKSLQLFANKLKANFFDQAEINDAVATVKSQLAIPTTVAIPRRNSVEIQYASPVKNIQQIILKYSNKLGLQNFKREHKRNHSQPSISYTNKPENDEVSKSPDHTLKSVQSKNKKILELLMDQYEHKQIEEVRTTRESEDDIKKFSMVAKKNSDLAESTYLNFVLEDCQRAAKSQMFQDLVFAKYKFIQAQKKIAQKQQLHKSQ